MNAPMTLPPPRYACLELLGFVGQLKQTHRRLLCRMDVIKTLLTVLVSAVVFFFPRVFSKEREH